MTDPLRGVLTALATPFDAAGEIEPTVLRTLVDRSVDGGVHGVVACGSTGEFAAMTGAERRFLVEVGNIHYIKDTSADMAQAGSQLPTASEPKCNDFVAAKARKLP